VSLPQKVDLQGMVTSYSLLLLTAMTRLATLPRPMDAEEDQTDMALLHQHMAL